jgi:membrane protease YdiL (CAAX protease family)
VPKSSSSRLVIVIGLVLTLGLVLLKGNQFGETYLGLTPLQGRDLFWWSLLIATVLYIVLVERRPISSIGIRRPTWKTPAFGVGLAVVLFAIDPAIAWLLTQFHLNPEAGSGSASALAATPLWYRIILLLRAAIAEEVIFRGYAIERIEELTASRILAVLVPTAMFAYAHFAYWGLVPLAAIGAAGLVLSLFYLWRRDLVANMIAHFIVDAVALLF